MPNALSASIKKRRTAEHGDGTGRCLGLVGEALACKICLRGECSDQRCTLELARYVVALIEFKYYIYFISHGQATAHGGHAGLPEAERVFCTFMSHILTQRAVRVSRLSFLCRPMSS